MRATTKRLRLDLVVALAAGCVFGWMLGAVLIWIMLLAIGSGPGD